LNENDREQDKGKWPGLTERETLLLTAMEVAVKQFGIEGALSRLFAPAVSKADSAHQAGPAGF
jgi:hypothetical protein